MRLLTSLLYKVTLSSMILTAPAMISGRSSFESYRPSTSNKKGLQPSFAATVIKRFVDRPTVVAMRAWPANAPDNAVDAFVANAATATLAAAPPASVATSAISASNAPVEAAAIRATAEPVASSETKHAAVEPVELHPSEIAATTSAEKKVEEKTTATSASARAADAKAAELRAVVRQAALIYTAMDLQSTGLDSKAFEYAWRGYHNLVKKGLVHKSSVLSICDFSQSSRSKRMYVIDVEHKRLLYRTYVAHGQNSGDEFASNFSNDNDSYMSSLGFYITQRTYMGRNGLSLRLDGVDRGYNDNARKRMIVLHGSSYAGEKYMQDYGNLGTSLGCPALPAEVSGRIIRAVKDGSCLFIYHPTQQYLDNSTVLHG